MFGGASNATAAAPEYIAMHLRLGGMVGEPAVVMRAHRNDVRLSRLKQLLVGAECAQSLAARYSLEFGGMGQHPFYFATDLNPLREFIQAGFLPYVVASDGAAHHIDKDAGIQGENGVRVFVDLLLLARARCVVSSYSGYSHLAVAFAGALQDRVCWSNLPACAARSTLEGSDF